MELAQRLAARQFFKTSTLASSIMRNLSLRLYLLLEALRNEHGQDLIEYVLIGGVVALGAVAGMTTFAANVNAAFSNLGTVLGSYS